MRRCGAQLACLRRHDGAGRRRLPRRGAAGWRRRRPAAAVAAALPAAGCLCRRRLCRKAVDHIKRCAQLWQGGLLAHEATQHAQRDARRVPRRRRRRPPPLQEGEQAGVLRRAVRYGPQVQLQAVDQPPSAIHQPARVVQLQRRSAGGRQQHRRWRRWCSRNSRGGAGMCACRAQCLLAMPRLPKRHRQRQRAADGCCSRRHDVYQHDHSAVDVMHLQVGASRAGSRVAAARRATAQQQSARLGCRQPCSSGSALRAAMHADERSVVLSERCGTGRGQEGRKVGRHLEITRGMGDTWTDYGAHTPAASFGAGPARNVSGTAQDGGRVCKLPQMAGKGMKAAYPGLAVPTAMSPLMAVLPAPRGGCLPSPCHASPRLLSPAAHYQPQRAPAAVHTPRTCERARWHPCRGRRT